MRSFCIGLCYLGFTKSFKKQEGRWITIISHIFNKHELPSEVCIHSFSHENYKGFKVMLYCSIFLSNSCLPHPQSRQARVHVRSCCVNWIERCGFEWHMCHTFASALQSLCASLPPGIHYCLRESLVSSYLKLTSQRAPVRTPRAPALALKQGSSHSGTDCRRRWASLYLSFS